MPENVYGDLEILGGKIADVPATAPTPRFYQLMNELISRGVQIEQKVQAGSEGQWWLLFVPDSAVLDK